MSYYRLQARAPGPKTKKEAPRFAPPCVRNPLWQGLSAALAIVSLYQIHYSKFSECVGVDTMCAVGASVGANRCIVGAPIGAWVRRGCIRRCILEPWVQNGCIISFHDAPMQYAYAPMSKNGCIKEKESPAANLLAVSKKATGLL